MSTNSDEDEDQGLKKQYQEYIDGDMSGILTEIDRKYLIGEKSFCKIQTEQKRRQRIRNRLRTAFIDINLAAHYLDEKDREILFKRIIEPSSPLEGAAKEIRHSQLGGLAESVEFAFDGIIDSTEIPVRTILNETISEKDFPNHIPQTWDKIRGKLANGVEPSFIEYTLIVEEICRKNKIQEVFDINNKELMADTESKIAYVQELSQRDLSELWYPVLEAEGDHPYTENKLQELKKRTKHTQEQTDLKANSLDNTEEDSKDNENAVSIEDIVEDL